MSYWPAKKSETILSKSSFFIVLYSSGQQFSSRCSTCNPSLPSYLKPASIHDRVHSEKGGWTTAVVHPPFSEWTRSWIDAGFRYEGRDGLQVEHLDENCCPEEYKTMKKEDFDKIVSDFFAGQYDILLCNGNYYNNNRLFKRDSPIGKPAVIEKLPIRMKSGVKGKKWKLMEGVWPNSLHQFPFLTLHTTLHSDG